MDLGGGLFAHQTLSFLLASDACRGASGRYGASGSPLAVFLNGDGKIAVCQMLSLYVSRSLLEVSNRETAILSGIHLHIQIQMNWVDHLAVEGSLVVAGRHLRVPILLSLRERVALPLALLTLRALHFAVSSGTDRSWHLSDLFLWLMLQLLLHLKHPLFIDLLISLL